MSFTHEYNKELQIDLITSGYTKIMIKRKGAELIGWQCYNPLKKNWTGLLYRDSDPSLPEKGWKNHATVLFPIVGRLKGNKSTFRDKDVFFETNHGFARNSIFNLEESRIDEKKAELIYSIKSNQETKRFYPFDFIFQVIYTITEQFLSITFKILNKDHENPLYFSCGWHPGFSVNEGYQLYLKTNESTQLIVGDDNLLTGEMKQLSQDDFQNIIKKDLSKALILKIDKGLEREVILSMHDRELVAKFYDCEFIGFWSNNRNEYICIEPWQGVDDLQKQSSFDKKMGIVLLEPDGAEQFSITVEHRFK